MVDSRLAQNQAYEESFSDGLHAFTSDLQARRKSGLVLVRKDLEFQGSSSVGALQGRTSPHRARKEFEFWASSA